MRTMFGCMLLAVSLPSGAIELERVRSGIACPNTPSPARDARGWICHVTERVLVSDQGTCTFNRERLPCTWVGFEFDYRNAKPEQTLQCTSTTSEPTNSGNPEKIVSASTATQHWDLPLPAGDGHFFNPQYIVYSLRDPVRGSTSLVEETTCRADGEVVFEQRFEFVFPVPPGA